MKTASVSKDEPRRELILGIATLVIAAVYYLMAVRIPESDIADVIGAQGLPKTYAALLAMLSILLIARALRARQLAPAIDTTTTVAAPRMERSIALRTFGMLLNGVVYVIAVPWLGYILSITLLIGGTIYLQGGTLHRRAVAVAFGGALLLWLLFVRLLHIAHPAGIWPSLF